MSFKQNYYDTLICEATKRPAYVYAFDPSRTHIPLTTDMIRRVIGTPRIKAYHITDSKGFQKLQSLQGKKSQISCFTNIEDLAGQMSGVNTTGGVLVKLDADEILNTAFDSYSVVDTGGRRWVSTEEMHGGFHTKISNIKEKIIKKFLQNKKNIRSWIERHNVKIHSDMEKKLSSDFLLFYEQVLNHHAVEFLESCDKSDLYKALIDFHNEIEPIFEKHKDDIMNQRKFKSGSNYNEVICNNITITKVYVMKNIVKEFEEINPGWNPIQVDSKSLKLIKL
jgi:hypothetical protein